MWGYARVRDELGDAQAEVGELARLLAEAVARRDRLLSVAPRLTWMEWILTYLGYQVKGN